MLSVERVGGVLRFSESDIYEGHLLDGLLDTCTREWKTIKII